MGSWSETRLDGALLVRLWMINMTFCHSDSKTCMSVLCTLSFRMTYWHIASIVLWSQSAYSAEKECQRNFAMVNSSFKRLRQCVTWSEYSNEKKSSKVLHQNVTNSCWNGFSTGSEVDVAREVIQKKKDVFSFCRALSNVQKLKMKSLSHTLSIYSVTKKEKDFPIWAWSWTDKTTVDTPTDIRFQSFLITVLWYDSTRCWGTAMTSRATIITNA